ncbi:hypothetical protein DVH24_030737 [Malus domestica]|uniref:MULE transposase domain-containing protein n=1 Tax=Malus domestica TaxID=3750 RepID=A0A498HDQ5_MALDO|nr:hypothetical protein DVH24_030737 [Malus domestica]
MILLLLFPFFSTLHFLSCATRLDQGFFPLAFALVDAEDEANWTWFLMNLSAVLSEDERTITFISDRHKGLLQSVANVFPTSPHGFCIYHIEKNIKTTYPIGFGKTFRKKMVQLFKNCAYSSTPEVFDVNLQILRKKDGGLIDKFFEDLPKENYSDAFFLGANWYESLVMEQHNVEIMQYSEMWSNVAESFNSWIRKERLLPIFQLVESIRVKLMVMNAERRIAAEKWNSYLCPEMENQLDKLLEVGRHWHVSFRVTH